MLVQLIGEVKDVYKTLQSLSPGDELLKYVSLDENGITSFSNVKASERFVERFGDGMSIFGWKGSLEE